MLADRPSAVWLRDAMAERSLSAPTLAKRLNLPQRTVADWLHGITRPDGDSIAALAEVLDVTIAKLQWSLEGSRPG
jgi:transcriptional regulator with XRE-family HTH domain